MKKAVLLMGIILVFGMTGASAADPIGLVIAVEGSVTAISTTGESRDLKLKSPVYPYDRIVTGPDSKTQIMFDDDSIISQGERSEMIIDEYVYQPTEKKQNRAFFKMIKGMFRAVTGKIVDLNEEGFRVQTGKAIIGIRGCELAFRVGQLDEDIYIIEITEGRSIVIETEYMPQGTMSGQQVIQALEILEPGTVVRLMENGDVLQEEFSLDEVKAIILSTDAGRGADGYGEGSGDEEPRDGAEDGGGGGDDSGLIGRIPGNDGMPGEDDTGFDDDENLIPQADAVETPAPTPLPTAPGPAPEPTPVPTPVPTSGPTPLPTSTPAPSTKEVISTGNNWEWGVWKESGGKIVDMYTDGNYLSQAEVQALIDGAVAYNLSGVGTAGAVIRHNEDDRYIDGSCNLDVNMGGGSPANWGGYFSLDDGTTAGDFLQFRVENGTFVDGNMVGQAAYDYYLHSQGQTFGAGSLIQNEVDGKLVGPGSATPVSGATGQFRFDHGGTYGPAVQGAYGTDLNPY
jgi:hypothetical protein